MKTGYCKITVFTGDEAFSCVATGHPCAGVLVSNDDTQKDAECRAIEKAIFNNNTMRRALRDALDLIGSGNSPLGEDMPADEWEMWQQAGKIVEAFVEKRGW